MQNFKPHITTHQLFKLTAIFILIILSTFFCFYNLGKPPIELWDEQTNINVVNNTLESNDILALKLKNKMFFEKPPLWYWCTMFLTKTFGINNFAFRFTSALSGTILILTVFYLGWKIFSYRAGLIAALSLLATRQLFIKNPHIFSTHTLRSADLDALHLLLIMLAFGALFKLSKFEHSSKIRTAFWTFTAAILTALAFLVKGPFAFIPAIIFFTFFILKLSGIPTKHQPWLEKPWLPDLMRRRIKKKKANPIKKTLLKILLLYSLVFVIIAAPWHIYMFIRFRKEFLNSYFGYHVIKRGILAIEGHHADWLFYIKLLFNKKFFFSGEIFLLAIIYLVKTTKSKLLQNFALFSCLAGSLLSIFLVSLIQTKLSWYILPAYPFIALLIGKLFCELVKIKNLIVRNTVLSIFILILLSQVIANLFDILQL